MTRKRKLSRSSAEAIIVFNYGDWRYDDPEWHYEMIDMLLEDEDAGDARRLCDKHGYRYPPKEFWDEWYGNVVGL